jgi:hypothetical protein
LFRESTLVVAAIIIVPVAVSPSHATGGSGRAGIFIPFITGSGATASPPFSADGQPANQPQVDNQTALVELKGAPLSTSVNTRPAPGKKIDFNSSAVKASRPTGSFAK